jgi:hypothetical protein
MDKERNKRNIELLGKELFWDIEREKLDIRKDKYIIIERVINYGKEADEKVLYRWYSKGVIKRAVKKRINVQAGSLEYICAVLGIKEEQCRCYKEV